MLLCANAALEENKQKINELNVFPVPDGDTGTNMSLTIGTAAAELKKKAEECGANIDGLTQKKDIAQAIITTILSKA